MLFLPLLRDVARLLCSKIFFSPVDVHDHKSVMIAALKMNGNSLGSFRASRGFLRLVKTTVLKLEFSKTKVKFQVFQDNDGEKQE